MNLCNKPIERYIIICIIVLLLLILYYIISNKNKNYDNNLLPKWNRNKCDYVMSDTIKNELIKNNLNESSDNWNLYFPCTYDNINKEISEMPKIDGGKYFIIENCDLMIAKQLLWQNILSYYGFDKAISLLPNSYVLQSSDDLKRLTNDFDGTKIYIMKKNVQRQEGLKITNDLVTILNGYQSGYILAQELLQDPYIISGRKTNMRFYVLVLCLKNKIYAFVYNDGFMYYTKDLSVKNSTEDGPNITTGYIDRQVYIDNPLTHHDLVKYLDDPDRINLTETEIILRRQYVSLSKVYFHRIYIALKDIFMAYVGKICNGKKFNNNKQLSFQLFGVDVGMSDTYKPKIMEINKGPDLSSKDERDGKIKSGVVNNMFKIIGLLPDDGQNNYIQLFEADNSII